MTDGCAEHRPYLAALADGEPDLVPAATRQHVAGCDACRFELDTHALLGARLKEAVTRSPEVPAPSRTARPVAARVLVPVAAAAALVIVALGAHLATSSGPDPLAAAVTVADREPEYWSSNPGDLADWCRHAYGDRVPAVAVAGLRPIGARMDWPNGIGIATVTYSYGGKAVHISWLGRAVGGPAPSEVTVDGTRAVVVRAHGITAVVTGAAPEAQLETIAGKVAATE